MKLIYNYILPSLIPFISSAIAVWLILLDANVRDFIVNINKTLYGASLIILPLVIALISSIPAIQSQRLETQRKSFLANMFIQSTQKKLEQAFDRWLATWSKQGQGTLHLTLMVPTGIKPFRYKVLRSVAASSYMRHKSGKFREFKWGEGVAGKVWAIGEPISLAVAWPDDWKKYGLKPPQIKNEGYLSHSSACGVAVPVWKNQYGHKDVIGVLNLGSTEEKDYDLMKSTDTISALLELATKLREDTLIFYELWDYV